MLMFAPGPSVNVLNCYILISLDESDVYSHLLRH